MGVKKNSFKIKITFWILLLLLIIVLTASFIVLNKNFDSKEISSSLIKENPAKISLENSKIFGNFIKSFLSGFQVSQGDDTAVPSEDELESPEESAEQNIELSDSVSNENIVNSAEINEVLPDESASNLPTEEPIEEIPTETINKSQDEPILEEEIVTAQNETLNISQEINLNKTQSNISSIKNETNQNILEINQTTTEKINLTINQTNETIENILNNTQILQGTNFTINESTIQYGARLGQPVKWKKILKLNAEENETLNNLEITLPKTAGEVSVKKIFTNKSVEELNVDVKNEKIVAETEPIIFITGQFAKKNEQKTGSFLTSSSSKDGSRTNEKKNNIFNKISKFFRNFFSLVGRVIDVVENEEEVLVNIQEELEDQEEIEIEYFTEAPYSEEIVFNEKHKKVNVVGSNEVHYENILAFSNLSKEVLSKDEISLYWLKNDSKELVDFNGFDKNKNEQIDYIEWIVPSLSNQTYEIILITKAQHLDSNKNFISDIYEQVKELDGNWSEQINKSEYVRVTFEKNLTNENDITFYARSNRQNTFVKAYHYNSSQLIVASAKVYNEGYYTIYLENMTGEHDIFDLKIINSNPTAYVEFEHIIDPGKEKSDYEEFIKIYNVANLNENSRVNNGTLVGTFNNSNQINFTAGQSYRIEIHVTQITENSTGELRNPFHEKIQGNWEIDINGSDAPNITIINGTITLCQNFNIDLTQGVGQNTGTQKITWSCSPPEKTIEDLNKGDQVKMWYVVDIPLNASNKTNNVHFFGKSLGANNAEITNIFTTISDLAPTNPSPSINSTDGTNRTKQDLNCFSTISDPNGDKLNVTIKWFKNSTEQLTIDYNSSFTSGTLFSAFLDSGNTTKGEIWNCGMRLFDGEFFSNLTNSLNLTILNTPPIVNLSSPPDGNTTTNRTPTFIWNASDDDNDILTYDLNVSCYPGCSLDNRYLAGLNESNHTIENDLQFLSDNNFYYNWSVRANDGEVYGEFSKERRINIQALLTISLINASVNFGELTNGETKNTTSENPGPLIIQNDGNSFLNISVNVTSIFSSTPSPTSNYQLKIGNSTEPGSFDLVQSLINFFNAPITTTMAIVRLNHSDPTDTARIDLLVKVPDDEPAGNKSSTIIFTSTLGE